MRRVVLIFMSVLVMTVGLMAQSPFRSGLNISAVFDGRYHDNPKVTETIIKGDALQKYKLTIYRGLTFDGMAEAAETLEPLLAKDGTSALEREVSYKGGHLYYAFYQMPSMVDNIYLFYLNRHLAGGDKITLIYMRGDATIDDIKKML